MLEQLIKIVEKNNESYQANIAINILLFLHGGRMTNLLTRDKYHIGVRVFIDNNCISIIVHPHFPLLGFKVQKFTYRSKFQCLQIDRTDLSMDNDQISINHKSDNIHINLCV